MSGKALGLAVVALYFAAVVVVGHLSNRMLRRNREDFFLASRSFGVALLFFAVLGTNLSAFAMLGAPGAAYRYGVGVYGMVAAGLSITFPLLFYFVGHRVWLLGKRYGYSTPVQMFADRFESPTVGVVVFVVMVAYTIPYVVIGQIGSGLALSGATDGAIPYWAGSLAVTVVVGLYVAQGGMRATALTNAVQVLVFMAFLVTAAVLVPPALGGADELGRELVERRPDLLRRSAHVQTSPIAWIMQVFTFSAAMMCFPQIFVRMLAARSGRVIRNMAVLYPLGFLLTFLPAISLAVWGSVAVPGLDGQGADNVIIVLMQRFMPAALAGFALAALFAMIMSTMDAQVLALSHLFTTDIADRLLRGRVAGDELGVKVGRWFVAVVLAVGFGVSLVPNQSIFDVANFAFTGFGVVFPVLVGMLYSRRLNKQAALAGLVTGSVLAPLAYFGVLDLGPLPSLPVVAIETVVMIAVAATTRPQPDAADRFVGFLRSTFARGRTRAVGPEIVPTGLTGTGLEA
ncbi:MAG TPA: sodium:solute symporter family protein [Actinomycetota bacterium]|nr:sodium:solute symporter family protein [Actinomycetota bacterium]